VFIDGQVVVDNGGRRDGQLATGSIRLASGAHPLLIRYVHGGGSVRFDLFWAGDESSLTPVPAWALRPRRVRSQVRLAASVLLDLSLALSEWIWVAILVLGTGTAIGASGARLRTFLERSCAWRPLRWILAGSLVLSLAGIWWGLPGSWVAIEVTPRYVLDALSQHFSHGWFDAYPPFHFYLLTAVMSPMLLLNALGLVNLEEPGIYTLLIMMTRLVSVAASAGIVIATCLCGTMAFGRRAGLFAAAILALTAPFLYYSKTANVDVPYLFWFALSLVFYLRLLTLSRLQDYVLFAASATLAVCTKDQAYGLYLLAPFVIIEHSWRVNRQATLSHPLRRAVFDRRLAAAAITSAVLFTACHNLLFNTKGFLDHVRFIAGPGSEKYRVFEPTLSGHLELLRLSGHLVEASMGWPLFLLSVTGLIMAATIPALRRMAVWLMIPVVSYYLGFINLILYNYDRFVLPMCLVLALFGGLAVDVFLSSRTRGRAWRFAGVAGLFMYSLLYAGTVDVLMIGDSRYAVERWMTTHISRDELVGASGLQEYLPRLSAFRWEDISNIAELQQERPAYVVLNADYARAVPPETGWGILIAGLHDGTLGYRLVGRFRRESPWPWLPGAHPDLVGARQETVVFSTLRNINPTIEIFRRDTSAARVIAASLR
jgi:hypothetical protein